MSYFQVILLEQEKMTLINIYIFILSNDDGVQGASLP